MSQQELLSFLLDMLANNRIDYMLTGSVVSSLQGEPRATHDIDVLVILRPDQVETIVNAFQAPEFYVSEQAIHDALAHRSMFNVLSLTRGEKIDFWILTDEPFDQSRFRRKQIQECLGHDAVVSTPEDTILAKLRWSKMSGGSEKQLGDALHVYELNRDRLDHDYLDRWASQLGVDEEWRRIRG